MDYGAVVVGGGHNGLTCAAYLARAGARVLVLERRGLAGGCGTSAASIPELPEVVFNPGPADLLGVPGQPVYRDFRLDRHGLELIPNDPFYFMPFPDGRSIFIHRSVEETVESIRAVSREDAAAYHRSVRLWSELDELLGPFFTRPAPPPGRRAGRRRQRSIG